MAFSKRIVFGLSFIALVLFVVFLSLSIQGKCLMEYFCDRPHDDSFAFLFFPFVPLFIFSLITYFLREEVYRAWWQFARVATPVSMLLIALAPSYSHDWMFPIEKGSVAVFTSLIFSVISIVVIVRCSRACR